MELFQELNGCCPHCGREVNIVEGMVYDYTLNKDGVPNYLNSEEYRVAAYCKNCNTPLIALPNTNGGYTIYPINIGVMNQIKSLHDIFGVPTKTSRSSALGIRLLESEEINPFTNVKE